VQKAEAGDDVIFLSIGDPDFDTPPVIVDEAIRALHAGRTHYADFAGPLKLREVITRVHEQTTGCKVSAKQVVVMSGGQASLFATMMCLVGPGDEVIVPDPMYTTYEGVVGATGATVVTVPLRRDKGFHLNTEDVRAAITERTRVILLNFPHNPTGAVLHQHEIDALASICHEHNLWVVSDEVYASLMYEGDFISPASGPGMQNRTCVISSLSKSHAMPGWRMGWVVAPGELPVHIKHAVQCMMFGSPPFIMDAAIVALDQDHAEIIEMRATYKRRRDLVCRRLEEIQQISFVPPEGGMFVMVDVSTMGLSATEFATRLVDTEGVSMIPGDGFGPGGAGFLRLSLTASEQQLSEAMNRLARFINSFAG
jgi:arginine:pyruvate transaminase